MQAHADPVRKRLELLGFLVNAPAFPPEPRLVHERPMRRVHQSDNSVVNVRSQLTRKMLDLVFVAQHRKRRRRRNLLRQLRSRSIHINPNVAVALLTWIMPSENALYFQFILARKRWNLDALPAARIKPPSVVAAFHNFPVEPSVRQRNPAMRARIPH